MRKLVFISFALIFVACSKPLYSSYSTNSNWVLVEKFDNPIHFKNLQKNVEVSIDNGKIIRTNDSTYNVLIDTVRFTRVFLKKGNKIDTLRFSAQDIAKPHFLAFSREFHWKKIDQLSISEFRKIQSFRPVLPNYNYSCSFEIVSFDVIKIDMFDNIKRCSIIGYKLDNQLERMIKNAEIGDTFIFDNIKLKFIGVDKEIFLDDVVVKLK